MRLHSRACVFWTNRFHWQNQHEKAGGDKGIQNEVGVVANSVKQLQQVVSLADLRFWFDAGIDLGVMNYGIGHMSGMCFM